jgi:type IV pilus assembly protein PilC
MPEEKNHFRDEVHKAIKRSFRGAGEKLESVAQGKEFVSEKKSNIAGFLKGVNPRRVESFTRELGILLGSGVSLLNALKLLAGRESNYEFKNVLIKVYVQVENGSSLWAAISKFPHVFPSIYANSVKAGESSGRLENALEELSKFYEFEISARKKIKNVAFYPTLVIVLAVIVVIILSVTIFPVFKEMLAELGTETPAVINIINGIGTFITGYWFAIILFIALLFVLPVILRQVPGGDMLIDRIKLKIPIFGKISLKIIVSRFSRNLAILLSSGVKITDAFDACAKTAGNSVVAEKLIKIKQGIEKGESLESLLKNPGVLPHLLVDLLVVGEQSGELEKVLNRAADVYSIEADDSISSLASIMEPVLILGMGVLVAFVFLSLFIPYINILKSAGAGSF